MCEHGGTDNSKNDKMSPKETLVATHGHSVLHAAHVAITEDPVAGLPDV